MNEIFNAGLLQSMLNMAAPVLLAALGCLMTDHVGIMNIGVDGIMLIGAFFGMLGSYLTGSAWLGVLLAAGVGLLLGLIYYVFVIKFGSDEFIIGVALNIFAGGLTVFLLSMLFGNKGASPRVARLPTLHVDFLDRIPVIGPLLNDNTPLVYIGLLLVLMCYLFIYKTPRGFWLRSAGEHPESLRAAGRSPERMKCLASVLCGILAAMAGAHLSLGEMDFFSKNMTASRGYVAVACVIFGMSSPPKVLLAALLFGFIDALGIRLQAAYPDFEGLSNLTSMAPYIVTVAVMVLFALVRRSREQRRARAAALQARG